MMQTELMYRDTRMSRAQLKQEARDSRETIHSGHFMVSDFEAEAQDDEDELAVPVPEEEAARLAIIAPPGFSLEKFVASSASARNSSQQLSIETSLNKLFQCMSLAYRQKLTSPKWNRFKGIRLRWKDKIRLNNVIWRCWHMQFILKQNTLVCQFASPLDVGTHNKPEAVVLEGKYWKRKLEAVKAEYKKWRMFYRNKTYGCSNKDGSDMLESMDTLEWDGDMESFTLFGIGAGSSYSGSSGTAGDNMMVDEDYRDLIHDTLFTTISSNQPMYFPNSREIVRGATIADFMQPSLGPLQPNLDDFMDNLEPLHEFLSGSSKLAPVPEEEVFHNPPQLSSSYPDLNLMLPMNQLSAITATDSMTGAVTTTTTTDIRQQQESASQQMQTEDSSIDLRNLQYTAKIFTQPQQPSTAAYRNNVDTFNQIQQNYEQQLQQQTQPVREKQNRQSRSALRTSRLAQQQQQQQQAVFQSVVQQQQQQRQLSAFTVPQRNYSMEIQNSHLSVGTGQLQLPLPDPSSQMQTLLNQQQQTFGSTEVQHHQQVQSPQVQKQMKSNLSCKPYSKIPSQGYKFSSPTPNFDAQQCKFTSNNIKMLPAQQQQQQSQPVVATTVSTQQSGQPQHVLLQCKPPAGIDLTAPALHPTKLLPRPAVTAIQPQPAVTAAAVEVKQEVFAVPKYQMKAKSRSRSSSSLNAPRMHPPPLVSAVSDPALNLNNNVLLAHLLTSNTSSVYGVNPDKASTSQTQSVIGVKHILPMLTSGTQVTNASHLMNAPVTTVLAASNIQNQGQQQLQNSLQQPSTSQGILLNTTVQSQNSNPNSPKDSSAHSPQAVSLSPLHSPMSLGSPLSPNRGYIKPDSEQRQGQYKEQRRVGHIHAEQKRRYNIKNGFDLLYSLIPQLSQNPNTKMSKAAMLQKGADYITILRAERQQLKEEMDNLRSQIDSLHADISNCQAMLPATGAPVSRQRTSKMKEMFDDYVRVRTRDNWKFWIFSILLEPLMLSFNTSVSTASVEDLYRTTQLWVEQHCSLVDLRPAVLHSLRRLCTTTDILHDPSRLPEEALAAVNKTEQKKSTQ